MAGYLCLMPKGIPTFVKNIQILRPNKGALWSRKSHSVEKTAFFEVFRKALADRWLHGLLSVNGRFTKSEFAKA